MLRPSGDQLGTATAPSPPLGPVANLWLTSSVTPEPSAFIMRIPPSPANTILVPSGDHDGEPPRPNTLSLHPSALMTRISLLRTNAILLPSADQAGMSPCVSRVTPEPSAFAT